MDTDLLGEIGFFKRSIAPEELSDPSSGILGVAGGRESSAHSPKSNE